MLYCGYLTTIRFDKGVVFMKKIFWIGAAVVFLVLAALNTAQAATFTVSSGADSGTGSLRQAVLEANANSEANTININASVKEIKLQTSIGIDGDVEINGQGVTIRGSKISRIFHLLNGTSKFNRVTFTDGYVLSENGGAVNIDASVARAEFVNCTFFDNRAGQNGGAVYLYGGGNLMTTFTNCTLTGNSAGADGGGVALAGGAVQFTASIVTGNSSTYNADIYVSGGTVSNLSQYNVVGDTNVPSSFPSSFNNDVNVAAADIFKFSPPTLSEVDGVQVVEIKSTTSDVALDKIPATILALPTIDARGAERPQMHAIDAGAYELSPVALNKVELIGGIYVQRGTSEVYSVVVEPYDATLDVRNYVDGIQWTVSNPVGAEVISVDAYGRVSGFALGEATLRATAHGWDASGNAIMRTDTKTVKVGTDPLPRPTVTVSFENKKDEEAMQIGSHQTLRLNLTVLPEGTPYKIVFESSDSITADVHQTNETDTSVLLTADNIGQSEIRVTVTAENSKGTGSAYDSFMLTVTEQKSGGGGGGCNTGFGASFLGLALLALRKNRKIN